MPETFTCNLRVSNVTERSNEPPSVSSAVLSPNLGRPLRKNMLKCIRVGSWFDRLVKGCPCKC
jgi:hypothetical protein